MDCYAAGDDGRLDTALWDASDKGGAAESYRRKSGRVDVVSHWPVCFYGLVQPRDGNSSVQDFALDAAKAVRGLL